jgi:hypothetical protein
MRKHLRAVLAKLIKWTADRPPDQSSTIRYLNEALVELSTRENAARAEYMERCAELAEAVQMAGAGPWKVSPAAVQRTELLLKEARERYGKESYSPVIQISESGAIGDVMLALQNVEWRAEAAQARMEFSRWGIQSIILIVRLYYMTNPIMRRLIDVSAAYVFARGFEVTSNDPAANEQIKRFFENNKEVLGQNAVTDLERRKDYDGSIYWVFFADEQSSGEVKLRTFDATEIEDIVCNPEDSDEPWLYKRVWTQENFDLKTGHVSAEPVKRWYPALRFEPADKPDTIGDVKVDWNARVHHRKCGGVAKWKHGCPRMYPAMYWAKQTKKYLEGCANVNAALSQIAMTATTKGGQQAIAGLKQTLSASGPSSSMLDINPPAVSGSTFASGPGTQLAAFKSRGAGSDPEECRQYKLMACMVKGVPETFLADVSTGNLATAQSLDRPTEAVFLEFQEAWREDFLILTTYALEVSSKATSGKLREARTKAGKAAAVQIVECRRRQKTDGSFVYEAFQKDSKRIELRVNFPAIREGDMPTLVAATVSAMTLNGGTPGRGIDERAGVLNLYDLTGVENGGELIEQQYPEDIYDPLRASEEGAAPDAPPIGAEPNTSPGAGTEPAPPGAPGGGEPAPGAVKESVRLRLRINSALRRVEKSLRS